MEQQTTFPVWAIILIVVLLIIILLAIAIFFMKKRRTRSLSVDTIHKLDSQVEAANEKKSMSTGSLQTVVTTQQKQHFNLSQKPCSLANIPLPQIPSLANTHKQVPTITTPQQNVKTDRPASIIDESDFSCQPPKPPQEITISLPLPPPSASFFSDKMELDGDHGQDFYDMYLSNKNNQEGTGFISIDLDATSMYSNVQQKAATIKSSLRLSLKMSPKPKRNSVLQTFSGSSSALVADEQTSAKKSMENNQSNQFSALEKQKPITATASTKTIIDMDPFQQQISTKQPFSRIDVTPQKQSDNQSLAAEDEDESPITPNPHLQEPVRAAKRVIRSASKKTKRRSMVAPEPTTEEDAENDETKKSKHGSIRSKHGSIRYASIRGPKNGSGEHMTITSGSIRRLVRESILFDDDILPSIPAASSAAMVSTNNAPKKSNAGISAVDIAGWWDNATPSKNSKSVNSSKATNSADNHNNETTTDSASSGQSTPNQYRASLNTSIFAFNTTISKASGSNASFFTDSTKDDGNNGGVSRHSSFRRGTLGRTTLRSITASATHGVNRSLKGLFDYSSSNSLSSKVLPDDSQKMELDSEPTVDIAEEKVAVVDQQSFGSMRQKSIRLSSSNSTRPSLPTAYLPISESSTKYALSDEDEEIMLPDQSSKKTAIEDVPQPLTKLITTVDDRKSSTQMTSPSSITSSRVNDSPLPLTPVPGDVDNIRRMLQDTWIANSTSTYSMASEADSIATTSTTQSAKLNPRQQNQSLLTKSLLTQQVAKRGSLLARHQDNSEGGFVPQQGPEPSASFSSSTVRTMVPANETTATAQTTEPISMRQNAITQHGSNKIQQQQPQSSSYESQATAFMTGSPRNSSAESSRGHSRKSSGGNSAATALRISSGGGGYAINAKTWNGRDQQQKRSSRASVTQPTAPEEAEFFDTLGSSVGNKRAFFSTMRKGQKTRGHIPWMNDDDDGEEEEERTPAQIERDRYLEKKA